MKYSGAEITIKLLEQQGITTIAGIPGGTNLPLYNALYKSSIRHILARHEQGAGYIAQGIARSSGKTAVCFATSGPGATNLLTAIADAKLDSIPIIGITGQVPTSLIGTDAFQEVDTYGLTLPITKHNFLVRSVSELLTTIPEAFEIAQADRPGPVVIDIPKDVQMSEIEINGWPSISCEKKQKSIDSPKLEQIATMINESKRPILYIGGGIIHSSAHKNLLEFANKNSIPVTCTLMGLGAFPADNSLYLGMLGMHGARHTNYLVKETDLLLAFGVRFDDRATGNIKKFCPEANIIHIDIDQSEINKIKETTHSLTGDIDATIQSLLPLVHNDRRHEWISYVEKIKNRTPVKLPPEADEFHPINIIKTIGNLAERDSIIVTDVGQHQMWVAQTYPFKAPRTLLTSGGLGTMGFGLPTAIGAALANPEKRIICFSGDGSILMNIQELATLADHNLNVTVIIMNNGHLGLVRQQQELFYEKNYIASKFLSNPDFITIGRGFGIKGYDLKGCHDLRKIFAQSLIEPGPCIVNAPIHYSENVMPMVPPGAGNHEMIGGESYDC
ncbi:MAG: biosynthetic-type acetolactate synthase large subunit [Candidatus Margulisiibacteriota bacterium]|nr:MAG: biosynthetic-type acetolactate synthase large subunit [Candidatus Margulisiibacteriota bacterium]HCY36252.1 biosynthetic-type acetolactate synthase large subunit [Candidatus Margulisiibacteriota bacterium]